MPNWKKVIVSGSDASLNSLNVIDSVVASTITGSNLNITSTGSFDRVEANTIDLDRLSLTSTQTTVPPLRLTANSLQDGVGALRIDGSQADIYLNPSTATHTTVTFAVNDDQRLAFGMDNNSDFYITRRTGSAWYDNTFVLDRDTGKLTLGYGLSVEGTTSGSFIGDGSGLTGITADGTLSSSAQIGSDISGSLSATAIAALGSGIVSGSAQTVANLSNQDVDLGTGNLTASTITGSLLRLSENGTGLRMTNVGAFDNDSGDFRIFATNTNLKFATNGQSGTRLTLNSGGISGSVPFSGSFVGDGSGLTGVSSDIVSSSTVSDTFTSTTTKTVTHNFGTKDVLVTVYDDSDNMLIPATVVTTDTNTVDLTFDNSLSGRVIVAKGGHIVSGSGATDWSSISSIPSGLVSSSAQIASDISGSFTATSASFATTIGNLTSDYTELTNVPSGIVSSSAQIVSLTSDTTSFTSVTAVTASHNLGTKNVTISIYDDNDFMIFPTSLKTHDTNNVYVSFNSSRTGRIVITK